MTSIADDVAFSSHGVVPVVVQDYDTGEVVLLAHMNPEALEKTAESGLSHFHSRQRPEQGPYGEATGHLQHVKSIHLSEDSDSLLIRATVANPESAPRSTSTYTRRWRPETRAWVEEGERGFVPPPSESD